VKASQSATYGEERRKMYGQDDRFLPFIFYYDVSEGPNMDQPSTFFSPQDTLCKEGEMFSSVELKIQLM
jgi:hypothetical protein